MTKEAKEQLADLQSKLEMANAGKRKILFFSFQKCRFMSTFDFLYLKRNDSKRWKNSTIRKRC